MYKRLATFGVLSALVIASCGGSSDSDGSNRGNRNAALIQSINPDKTKVTLCHATGSKTNPYTVITVDSNALKKGHGVHRGGLFDGTSKDWGDIIPPSGYVDASGKAWTNATLNWPEGQAIYEAFCKPKDSDDEGNDAEDGDDTVVVTTIPATTSTVKTTGSSTTVPMVTTTSPKVTTTTTGGGGGGDFEIATTTTTTTPGGDKPTPTTTAPIGETTTTVGGGDFEIETTTTVPTISTLPRIDPPSDPNPDPAPKDLPLDPKVEELVITPEQVQDLTGGNGTLRVSIDDAPYVDVPSSGITLDVSGAKSVKFAVVSPGAGGERYVAYTIVRPGNDEDGSNLLVVGGGILLVALIAVFLVALKRRRKDEAPQPAS